MGGGGSVSERRVALLRAVNVGGRQLAMADLRRIASDCGLVDPETLLASGNLLFGASGDPAADGEALRLALLNQLGLSTDVFVRDAGQIDAVIASNPFQDAARDHPSRLLVMILDRSPPAALDVFAPVLGQGEAVQGGPCCLYLWLPQGVGVSRLSNALIERRLKVRGTARNWNTLNALQKRLRVA